MKATGSLSWQEERKYSKFIMKINYAFIAFEEVRHDEFKQYMRMKAIFYIKGTTTG